MPKVKMVMAGPDNTGWIGEGEFDFAPRVGEQVYLPSGGHEVVWVGSEGDGSGRYSLIIGLKPTEARYEYTGI